MLYTDRQTNINVNGPTKIPDKLDKYHKHTCLTSRQTDRQTDSTDTDMFNQADRTGKQT